MVYESLEEDVHRALNTCVWPFLGLPGEQTTSSLRKQRRGTLADRVTNYAEVGEELNQAVMPVDVSANRTFRLGPPAGLLRYGD